MQDSIQIHLKAGRGPITVVTCEVGSGDAATSDPEDRSGSFLTLEESRIRTATLHTGNQHVTQQHSSVLSQDPAFIHTPTFTPHTSAKTFRDIWRFLMHKLKMFV